MSQHGRNSSNISAILRRHLGQQTVLGVAIPVLAGHIDAIRKREAFRGLTEKQMGLAFRELTSKFIKSDYHSTYIDRRLGTRGFLELSENRYRIRERLLSGLTLADLERLHVELVDSLRTARERRQAVISKLEEACSLPGEQIEQRYALSG